MTSSHEGVAPSNQALEDTVAQLVTAALGKKPGSVRPDDPLFSSQAGFDSFSLMELVLRLEDTFGLSIPDDELDPSIFHSIRTIASYVRSRLGQGI
jgi:acyl carrier protein